MNRSLNKSLVFNEHKTEVRNAKKKRKLSRTTKHVLTPVLSQWSTIIILILEKARVRRRQN